MAIQINSLPASEIITELYRRWENDELGELSSHWQHCGPQSLIKLNDSGVLKLSGIGFGDCQATNPMKKYLQYPFHWLTIFSYLSILPNRKSLFRWIHTGQRILKKLNYPDLFFSYDVFRQCCIANLLESYLKKIKHLRVLLIGDGYGILSLLLRQRFSGIILILVDILPALLFQTVNHQKAFSDIAYKQALKNGRGKTQILSDRNEIETIICHGDNLDQMEGYGFDCAINVASMQEMTPDLIKMYFHFIRSNLNKNGLFYCCNRQKKILPGGEILRFTEYPWGKDDYYYYFDEEPIFYRADALKHIGFSMR